MTSLRLLSPRLSPPAKTSPSLPPLPPLRHHHHSLMRTDLSTPSPPDTWDVVIPEHPTDLLQWASALKGDALVVCWLRNVCSVLELRSLETGELVRDIPLPGLGSVASFSGELHRVRRGNKTSPPGFSLANSTSSPSLPPLSPFFLQVTAAGRNAISPLPASPTPGRPIGASWPCFGGVGVAENGRTPKSSCGLGGPKPVRSGGGLAALRPPTPCSPLHPATSPSPPSTSALSLPPQV